MVHWLAIGGALGHGALAATTAHTDAVDNVTCQRRKISEIDGAGGAGFCARSRFCFLSLTLLGLVSQPASLVGSGGSRSAVEAGQLAVLPAADTQQEAHHVGLLLAP